MTYMKNTKYMLYLFSVLALFLTSMPVSTFAQAQEVVELGNGVTMTFVQLLPDPNDPEGVPVWVTNEPITEGSVECGYE